MFDGTVCTRKTDTVDFKLKEKDKQTFWQQYPVSKLQEEMFNKEVEQLFPLVIKKRANDSECGSPYFSHPEPKIIECFF